MLWLSCGLAAAPVLTGKAQAGFDEIFSSWYLGSAVADEVFFTSDQQLIAVKHRGGNDPFSQFFSSDELRFSQLRTKGYLLGLDEFVPND